MDKAMMLILTAILLMLIGITLGAYAVVKAEGTSWVLSVMIIIIASYAMIRYEHGEGPCPWTRCKHVQGPF